MIKISDIIDNSRFAIHNYGGNSYQGTSMRAQGTGTCQGTCIMAQGTGMEEIPAEFLRL